MKACIGCGIALRDVLYSERRKKYCSYACVVAHRKPRAPRHPCANCGKPIILHRIHCSTNCAYEKKRVTISCQGCGKAFVIPKCHEGIRKHCSSACQPKLILRRCLYCGKMAKKYKKFCSNSCASNWHATRRMAEVRRVICRACGREFIDSGGGTKPKTACSIACMSLLSKYGHSSEVVQVAISLQHLKRAIREEVRQLS